MGDDRTSKDLRFGTGFKLYNGRSQVYSVFISHFKLHLVHLATCVCLCSSLLRAVMSSLLLYGKLTARGLCQIRERAIRPAGSLSSTRMKIMLGQEYQDIVLYHIVDAAVESSTATILHGEIASWCKGKDHGMLMRGVTKPLTHSNFQQFWK